MTIQQAKELLALYRPGTADADDPDFAPALQLCEQEPDLKQWFDEHCAVYQSLRSKLKEIPVPEGLKEQIIAERKTPKVHHPAFWNSRRRRATAAGLAVIAAAVILFVQWYEPPEDTGFTGFRRRMISTALRSYGMDFQTENPKRIRDYLKENHAISDYALPSGLNSAQIVGCLATTWQDQPASMICFKTGKPLHPPQNSDLWLFVVNSKSVPGAPETANPLVQRIHGVTAATWTENGKTYVLAIEGDEAALRKYL